jgi:arginase family enzyme
VVRALKVTGLRGRTSDRTDGARQGAEALARLLGGEIVGDAEPARVRDWRDDLPAARPVLEEAAARVSAGAALLTASECTICIATLPAVARRVPGVRVLWLDAHGDFNTPETTTSGYLGGMCLAAACGRWDAGWDAAIDPARVHLAGVRDLEVAERSEIERAGVQAGVPEGGPVYVHLDCDVLDPGVLASRFPVPGGMRPEELRALLAGLRERVVGVEVTALEDPAGAGLVSAILEPLLG